MITKKPAAYKQIAAYDKLFYEQPDFIDDS